MGGREGVMLGYSGDMGVYGAIWFGKGGRREKRGGRGAERKREGGGSAGQERKEAIVRI